MLFEPALEGRKRALPGAEEVLALAAHDAPDGAAAELHPPADLLQGDTGLGEVAHACIDVRAPPCRGELPLL